MTRLTLALTLFGAMTVVPATAFAMEPYLPKSPKAFTKVDVDANGKVTAAEITPRAEKRFDRVDADRNGAVSAAEIEASLKKAMERRRDRILADLDTNKDGAISRAELDASVDRLIAAADADRDGGVTLDEAKSYRLAKLRKPATPAGEQAN